MAVQFSAPTLEENKDAIFKKKFLVPSSLVKEIEEVFSERRKLGGFEDGFVRMSSKTAHEIFDYSKEKKRVMPSFNMSQIIKLRG